MTVTGFVVCAYILRFGTTNDIARKIGQKFQLYYLFKFINMKKLFALLAVALGVVACQKDQADMGVNLGGEQEVMINVSLPEETRSASSSGFDFTNFENNGSYDLRFILEIAHDNGTEIKVVRSVMTSKTTSATFPVRLAPGRDYTFTVWADLVNEGSQEDRYYNILTKDANDNVPGLSNITFKEWTPNVEARDAFTKTMTKNYTAGTDLSMELTRPFAKIRVVATDIEDVRKFGLEPDNATVSYAAGMYTSFNAVDGTASNKTTATTSINYDIDKDAYSETTGQLTVFADYIFVPENGTISFNLDIKDGGATIKENNFSTAIPVECNKVTSIVGDVLTEGGNVSITINGTLEEKETINLVDTAESLQEIINNTQVGESANIALGGDIDLGDLFGGILSTRAAATLPIVIAEGKTLTLDLNGFKITTPFVEGSDTNHAYAFENHGTLTIQDSNGNGQIIARGIFNYGTMTLKSGTINACDGNGGYGVRNYEGAEFIMNGGSIVTSYEDGDTPGNGYDASPVRVDEGATATINGGAINNVSNFTVAIDNYGETTINGGTFTTIHTTIANSATMTINGGSFTCNGLEGVTAHAFWAAAGTATINGGTFDGKDNYNGFNICASKGAVVNINGGKFLPVHSGSLYGEGTIIVKGGTFFDQIAESRIDSDYKLVESGENWVVEKKPAIAKIGNVDYTSLAKAVAAVKDGETINLVANEVFTEKNYYDNGGWKDGLGYAGDKSFTIDLGGNTVSQNGALNDYLLWFKNVGSKANTITIKNGTLDAGTTAFCALCTASSHENELTINLENITLINKNSNGSTIKVRAGSTLNVNAGTKIIGQDSYLGIENWNATVNVYEGAEIYMNGTSSYNGCLIGVGGNGVANVYGGYGKGVSGGLIAMTSGGTINVSGGEWIANTDGTYANSNKSVLVAQSDKQYNAGAGNAVVNVTGGTFKGGYNCYGNAVGDAQINIKGGNFNANPASYVVAGYEVKEENGVYTVRKPKALADFEAAIAKGGEVTLAADITLVEPVVIEEGKEVVLNLNGKTITGNWHKGNGAIITNNGTLTIVGGTISSTGDNGGSAVMNNGILTIENATLNGAPNANGSWPSYTVNNIGTMIVENTTITSYHGAVASYADGAVVTLNNCTIDMAGIPGFTSHGIYTYNNGKVVVNGGTYENKATDQAGSGASVINGAVEVNAGTFSGRIENYYGTPVLKGGTFSVKPNAKFIAAGYKAVEDNGRWTVVSEQ